MKMLRSLVLGSLLFTILGCSSTQENKSDNQKLNSFTSTDAFSDLSNTLMNQCNELKYLDTLKSHKEDLADPDSKISMDMGEQIRLKDFLSTISFFSRKPINNCDDINASLSECFNKIDVQQDSVGKLDLDAINFLMSLFKYYDEFPVDTSSIFIINELNNPLALNKFMIDYKLLRKPRIKLK